MTQTVEQIVREHRQATTKLLRKINGPAKARAFLLKAGILEKHHQSARGVRLAKRFR